VPNERTFLDEPEPPVQRDRGGVARVHGQLELLDADRARPAKRLTQQRRADAAAPPGVAHEHPERRHVRRDRVVLARDAEAADDTAAGNGDKVRLALGP
jgi:hypothetical protein